MSAVYASRYEAVFLCLHPKEPKMSYEAAAKYMSEKSKTYVNKRVKYYFNVKKSIVILCKKTKKKDRVILRVFEKKSSSLRGRQAVLRKKSLNISNDTIRRHLLAGSWSEISKHSKETAVQKHVRKKIHLDKRKFGLRLE